MEVKQTQEVFLRAGSPWLQLYGMVLSKAGPGTESGGWELA